MSKTRHVGVALSTSALEALQRLAAERRVSLSWLLRTALSAPAADARPLPSGPERITLRVTDKEAGSLRAAVAARGESLSLYARVQLAALLRDPLPRRASSRRTMRRAARSAPAPMPSTARARRAPRRGRIALQVCGHTVAASEVEAAGATGLVWCAKCQTSRYPERS